MDIFPTKVKWAPLTKMKFISTDENKVMLYNPYIRKRILIEKSVLISINSGNPSQEILIQMEDLGFVNNKELEQKEIKEQILKWEKHGWGECLSFYLSSRDIMYQDVKDSVNDTNGREHVLNKFLKEADPPISQDFIYDIELPSPRYLDTKKTLGEILTKRVSLRRYKGNLSINELSDILWYGLTEVRVNRKQPSEITDYLKSYGSAFEIFISIYNIKGIEPGIYRYNLLKHKLGVVKIGDYRNQMLDIHMGQNVFQDASVSIFYKVNFSIYQWKYRHERALRNLYIESGRIMQKMIIISENFNAGSFITPALKDHVLTNILDLDPNNEVVIYSQTLGKKSAKEDN